NPAMGDLITLTADVAAEAGRETTFDAPHLVLGGALSIVQDLLTILADLGISGVLRTAMTNDWSFKASLRVPFVDAQGEDLEIPDVIKFADTGVTVEETILPHNDSASFEIGGSPEFNAFGLPCVGIIHFTIKLSTADGTSYEVLIGFGLAYEKKVEPFTVNGLVAITLFAVWGDTALGYGVGFLLKLGASIDPIASLELSVEGRLARILVDQGAADETLFYAAKLTLALEISIFLVLSVSVEYETKQVTVAHGPLTEASLPDIL
ncbi:MAG: hypothetical protein JWO56_3406, partial [Acidobacteria bacterium]|nr:hypothetical protein [Acidobacteriota bacterium]